MKSIILPFHCPPYSDCIWKPRNVKLTPLRLPSCNRKRLILGANGNGENRAIEDVELDQQQTMDIQFGILTGEDSKETSTKVLEKKSIKGMDGFHLKRPLPNLLTNSDVRKLTDFPNSQLGSKNNTGKKISLDLVRPVMRKEGKEAVSPDLNRLGSHTKTLTAESNSKNIAHEVLLRKPSAQNKSPETLGFSSLPIRTYFLSNKKEDKSKRHLEDIGLLRRPEAQAIRIDNNLNEIPRGLKAQEVIIEDSLGSKIDNVNAHAAAQKQISERGDMKGEHKISAIRPTMPKNSLMSTAHEMDSYKSNRNTEHECYHEMHGKEDVRSSASGESREMNVSARSSVKTDRMVKADVNISGLVATTPAKMNHKQAKQCIQDCKEGADFKAVVQYMQQTTSIDLESVKLNTLRPMGSPRDCLSEANAVKRKSRESLHSAGHHLVNEIPDQHSIRVRSETDTGLDLPPCGKEFKEKTHISDGPEDNSEKTFSHLMNSFPSDHSDGAEDVLDKTVHQSTSVDSELLYEMVPHASRRNTEKFKRKNQISEQAIAISSQAVKQGEDWDWALAEISHNLGVFEEAELLSCSDIGFVVSFGSILGLLPYRDVSFKKRPFPFDVWLQKKFSDPLKFQKEIGPESSAHFNNSMLMPGLTLPNNEATIQSEEAKSATVTAQESQNLLNWYNQYRTRFLSSFIGQKTRATITLVNRKSGRLLFSEKLKENQDSAEKKASVMDRLNIGDIVTCQVTRIISFGVFVELQGVSALIHHSELSWDPNWDANLHLKVGEVLKVKVCGLDRSLYRINLSLKQLKPDPLLENLESILKEDDDHTTNNLEHAELNTEWPEIESLIRELEAEAGIQNVSKGRFLLSPWQAPSFQVYLSNTHEDQYKIFARSENRVQEIIVQASLDRDEIKSAVVSCTSRVAQEAGL